MDIEPEAEILMLQDAMVEDEITPAPAPALSLTNFPEITVLMPMRSPTTVNRIVERSMGLTIQWMDWTYDEYRRHYSGEPSLTGTDDPFESHKNSALRAPLQGKIMAKYITGRQYIRLLVCMRRVREYRIGWTQGLLLVKAAEDAKVYPSSFQCDIMPIDWRKIANCISTQKRAMIEGVPVSINNQASRLDFLEVVLNQPLRLLAGYQSNQDEMEAGRLPVIFIAYPWIPPQRDLTLADLPQLIPGPTTAEYEYETLTRTDAMEFSNGSILKLTWKGWARTIRIEPDPEHMVQEIGDKQECPPDSGIWLYKEDIMRIMNWDGRSPLRGITIQRGFTEPISVKLTLIQQVRVQKFDPIPESEYR